MLDVSIERISVHVGYLLYVGHIIVNIANILWIKVEARARIAALGRIDCSNIHQRMTMFVYQSQSITIHTGMSKTKTFLNLPDDR